MGDQRKECNSRTTQRQLTRKISQEYYSAIWWPWQAASFSTLVKLKIIFNLLPSFLMLENRFCDIGHVEAYVALEIQRQKDLEQLDMAGFEEIVTDTE